MYKLDKEALLERHKQSKQAGQRFDDIMSVGNKTATEIISDRIDEIYREQCNQLVISLQLGLDIMPAHELDMWSGTLKKEKCDIQIWQIFKDFDDDEDHPDFDDPSAVHMLTCTTESLGVLMHRSFVTGTGESDTSWRLRFRSMIDKFNSKPPVWKGIINSRECVVKANLNNNLNYFVNGVLLAQDLPRKLHQQWTNDFERLTSFSDDEKLRIGLIPSL